MSVGLCAIGIPRSTEVDYGQGELVSLEVLVHGFEFGEGFNVGIESPYAPQHLDI